MQRLLHHDDVFGHPSVIGELSLGNLSRRSETLQLLSSLPSATVATPAELHVLIERHELFGCGIG